MMKSILKKLNSKMVVLNDLYEQLESHIEIDIQECTERGAKNI